MNKFILSLSLLMLIFILPAISQTKDDCLGCHSDTSMKAMDGRIVGFSESMYSNSVHDILECVDCHEQPGDYGDIPHYEVYRQVDCSLCHPDAVDTYSRCFHGLAVSRGLPQAPECADCHSSDKNAHNILPIKGEHIEKSCRACHQIESLRYGGSVHEAAAERGKASANCLTCHPSHREALPPSTGAINRLCESCHKDAMAQVKRGVHKEVAGEVMACASCHDVHATHKPTLDKGTIEACYNCHPGLVDEFKGSAHEALLGAGKMSCISCHRTHQLLDAAEKEQYGCGACHIEIEAEYRTSVHRMARLRGDQHSASCADCHHGHNVLPPENRFSPVNRHQIPFTCGKCHSDSAVITSDFVRLPISLPNYLESVHGQGWESDKPTAVCTNCHGTHKMLSAGNPESSINKQNIAHTCSQCHQNESREYGSSIHGHAVALGIKDSPSCTDCHDEHLIFPVNDPRALVCFAEKLKGCCAQCHEDPEMAARYGLPPDVIKSYQDSYHGWAVKRGGTAVARCIDCHNKHDIRSPLDPTSSINKDNVVATCRRCHPNSNAKFAASYSHILARNKLMVHDYVRLVYIVLITLVLGGMFLHNLIIFIYELKVHYRREKIKIAVIRMTMSERIQHLLLLTSFIGLAITGFALRFPDAWWSKILMDLGLTEEIRRIIHRTLAVIMGGASIYHIFYMLFTQRGRTQSKAILPRFRDFKEAWDNMWYYFGRKPKPPEFGRFDYTQKAEYWALIWGTALMGITGFVLWFPAIATSWLPAWVVRVCETVHFYEAILAVSAIVIWHWFFVIFLPKEYPMSWTWITGRMPYKEWKEHHGREKADIGETPKIVKGKSENKKSKEGEE